MMTQFSDAYIHTLGRYVLSLFDCCKMELTFSCGVRVKCSLIEDKGYVSPIKYGTSVDNMQGHMEPMAATEEAAHSRKLAIAPWRPRESPGPRLNIKTVLSTYGDFHVKDKTAVRTSYL